MRRLFKTLKIFAITIFALIVVTQPIAMFTGISKVLVLTEMDIHRSIDKLGHCPKASDIRVEPYVHLKLEDQGDRCTANLSGTIMGPVVLTSTAHYRINSGKVVSHTYNEAAIWNPR